MDDLKFGDQKSPLEKNLFQLLKQRRTKSRLRQLKSSPDGSVDLSSNDFLSLSTTREFRQDFISELQQATLPLGSTGSRLLDGNSAYAEELERSIAAFHGAEAGLLTNSGFDANVSIFTCLPQPGDIILYDELIHASVHDGMRQSRASKFISFRHNCVEDLSQILQNCANTASNVFISVETVYSMDGDVAPLEPITKLMEKWFPNGNCHLIVDEAHATGVYGPKGRGLVSELGLEEKVSVRLHTFGKALGCNGAIILCSKIIRLYLINYARPLIFTTFMSYASLSAIKTAYDWLQNGKTEQLAAHLFRLIDHLYCRLQSLAPLIPHGDEDILTVPLICPESPIFALMTKQPRALAAYCQAAGFIVRPVVYPTVPKGTERVRVCLHAGNTIVEVDRLVSRIREWVLQQVLNLPFEGRSSDTALLAKL